MLENLFRPWIVARLLTGAVTVALLAVGAVVAVQVLRRFREGSHGEGQIALERRAELVATLVSGALGASLLGLVLTVAGSHRSAHSIQGAMCAYGVLGSTPHGFWALATSATLVAAAGLWVVVHRLDLRLSRPHLTRVTFALALAVSPLAALDLWVTGRYLFGLDFQVVASCCSVGLDGGPAESVAGPLAGALASYGASLAALGLAAGACLFAGLRPGRLRAALAGSASVLATALGASAVVHHVAPHVYGTPTHRCPFCLLHLDAGALGWPLFGGLLLGAVLGIALPVLEALRGRAGEDAEVDAVSRRVGLFAAASFLIVTALTIYPVLHYRLVSGTTLLGP